MALMGNPSAASEIVLFAIFFDETNHDTRVCVFAIEIATNASVPPSWAFFCFDDDVHCFGFGSSQDRACGKEGLEDATYFPLKCWAECAIYF